MQHATLRQLKVFDAIVRHGSFSRAAEEMGLTQPTLSMQVKKISESVGMPLFEQVGKRIYLTEAGRALHQLCLEALEATARFDQTIADLKGMKSGRVRLVAVTTAEYFLPRLLGPFCNRYRGIEVALEVVNRERVLERLKANSDDFYVFGQPPLDVDVIARPFMENPLVVVAPAGHPLTGRTDLGIADIAEEPFLVREVGSGTRGAAERAFAEAGHRLKVRMELGSNEAIKQGVIGGLGLAVMPRQALVGSTGVCELAVRGFPVMRQWYLVWPAGKQLTVAARTLFEHLRQQAGAG